MYVRSKQRNNTALSSVVYCVKQMLIFKVSDCDQEPCYCLVLELQVHCISFTSCTVRRKSCVYTVFP